MAASLLKKHLREFNWLTYAYAGPSMSSIDLFKALKDDLKNGDLTSQIQKIIYNFKTIKKRKANLCARLNLPAKLSYLFKVSSELMFIKDYRKAIYQKSYVAMDPVIAELGLRLGVTNKEIRTLTLMDIRDALTKNKISFYKFRAKQRLKLCAYIVKNGKIRVIEGTQAKKMINKIKKIEDYKSLKLNFSEELKGSIAYPGLVRGRVKIILTKTDLKKIKIGDILVSSATNPDLISAMKKAAAFVTDTGGIICHAAIVARELKKPCVIGTKIATQVLHDGDFVEVDAGRGIIRIVK